MNLNLILTLLENFKSFYFQTYLKFYIQNFRINHHLYDLIAFHTFWNYFYNFNQLLVSYDIKFIHLESHQDSSFESSSMDQSLSGL